MPGRPKDIEHHQVDLRSKKARDVFRAGDVDALIHLGVMHDPRARPAELYSWNITGTTKLLEYCQAYRVPKVVLLSSANVYGPRPDNPQFLTEDAPLLAAQRFPQMRDLVEIDHLVSTFLWRAQNVETVILRPVHIVGPVHNAPSNYLRLERPPVLLGFDPMVQLIHYQDIADGDRAARSLPAGAGSTTSSAPVRCRCRRSSASSAVSPISIPHPMAKPLLSLAFRARACRASRSPSSTSSATSAWSTAGARTPSSDSGLSSGCGTRSTLSTNRCEGPTTATDFRGGRTQGCGPTFTPRAIPRVAPTPAVFTRARIRTPGVSARLPGPAIFRAFLSGFRRRFPIDRAPVSKR